MIAAFCTQMDWLNLMRTMASFMHRSVMRTYEFLGRIRRMLSAFNENIPDIANNNDDVIDNIHQMGERDINDVFWDIAFNHRENLVVPRWPINNVNLEVNINFDDILQWIINSNFIIPVARYTAAT